MLILVVDLGVAIGMFYRAFHCDHDLHIPGVNYVLAVVMFVVSVINLLCALLLTKRDTYTRSRTNVLGSMRAADDSQEVKELKELLGT